MAKAVPPSRESTTAGSRSSILMKTIVTLLVALIVMIGLTILIIWLNVRPKKPVYTIRSALIHNYSLSKDHHLSASYNFILKSFNPSKRMSIQYKKTEISVMFEHMTIARGAIEPWHQHKMNANHFKLDLASSNVELSGAVSQHLESAKSSNQVVLDVKLKGKLRSKMGIWLTKYHHLIVSCVHVVAHFSNSSMGSGVTLCDVDI